MSTKNVLFAGFGGQGILFSGKVLANAGLMAEMEVSWLPSYGPEMRGGTANCSVILSDAPVGSPIVSTPNVLIAMNRPSLDKYIYETEKDGQIFYDSSLIDEKIERADVQVFPVEATKLALENGLDGLANMIMLGKMIKESNAVSFDYILQGLKKVVSAKHADLLDKNIKAIELGYNY